MELQENDISAEAHAASFRAKAAREAAFPLEALQNPLAWQVERCVATEDSDRVRLLNLVAEVADLDAPPHGTHAMSAAPLAGDPPRGIESSRTCRSIVCSKFFL